jgi:hypothetical protein
MYMFALRSMLMPILKNMKAEIKTDGRLKSSELTANGTTAGFNVSSYLLDLTHLVRNK